MFEKWLKKPQRPLPEDPEELLALSDSLTDPRERRRCVEKALSAAPDSLAAVRAALMLGELGTGDRRSADFTQIKSWILTPFEKPGVFREEERRRLIREIFDHPLLEKCLSLCGDRDAFMEKYAGDLGRQYCDLFIVGAGAHSGAVFGFSTPASRLRAVSAPLAAMLENVRACPYLEEGEKSLLLRRMAAVFRDVTGGDMREVLDRLGQETRGEIRALLNDAGK